MSCRWIPKASVVGAHDKSLAAYGGGEGLRDDSMLESAPARPENLAAYGDPAVYDLAAAYAYGIAKNHPFVDGNKRTAFLTAYLFLTLNGIQLTAPEHEATAAVLALASGELEESGFSEWLKANSEAL
ncbi:MAG: type II toxin-antitoxin system death-on-curing family toxin [Pseudomonadota bacterium]